MPPTLKKLGEHITMGLSRYLEGGPLMWMLPLYLHVYQKSDYDMMIVPPFVRPYVMLLRPLIS